MSHQVTDQIVDNLADLYEIHKENPDARMKLIKKYNRLTKKCPKTTNTNKI